MVHRPILTERQRNDLLALPTDDPSMLTYYILSDEDIIYIKQKRDDHNQLGFALQLCALRYPGRYLNSGDILPKKLIDFIGAQLRLAEAQLLNFTYKSVTRYEHLRALQQDYGYRPFHRLKTEFVIWLTQAAIEAVYPKTEHQLCIVHQIRNSLKYVSYKDRKKLAQDLKPIYTASTEEEAHSALESFDTKWSKQYPQIAKSRYANWDNLMIFVQYPEPIRKVIYTTNAVESVNSQLRKVTKNKRVFPSDESVLKTLYLTIDYITRKWTMPIQNWNEAMAHFLIKFDDRI